MLRTVWYGAFCFPCLSPAYSHGTIIQTILYKAGSQVTTVYFVRHAQPNYNNHDDATRELTEKGLQDRKLVTEFLRDKQINAVLSSPYKRAVDTVKDFADTYGFAIRLVDDFRERKIESTWIEDFKGFSKKQWSDFDYKLSDGESLREVQTRNISALKQVLDEYTGKTVVVGSHGTALCTILQYFNPSFGYDDFDQIRPLMPWIVKFTFENDTCPEIQTYNLFEQ